VPHNHPAQQLPYASEAFAVNQTKHGASANGGGLAKLV
jgi:hypothetical protein